MAGSSLLALIDDIATLLDDIALMSKVAAKKTAGVLGDDLALNAQQVAGIKADRELPVVWAVAKGSFKNKLILVPAALAISIFAPWAIIPLLMAGGLFLCFEGFEKISHRFLHPQTEVAATHQQTLLALSNPAVDMVAYENDKIKGAIRTDFILSAEIVTITLGTVAAATFGEKVAVLSIIAVVITVGVYGLVAGIVKLDDAGLYLSRSSGTGTFTEVKKRFGLWLVAAAPRLMHALSIIGTAAMFMVGGGILSHGLPAVSSAIHHIAETGGLIPLIGAGVEWFVPTLLDMLLGVVSGGLVLLVVLAVQRFRKSLS
jgi:predicted DNA repair protein MutK